MNARPSSERRRNNGGGGVLPHFDAGGLTGAIRDRCERGVVVRLGDRERVGALRRRPEQRDDGHEHVVHGRRDSRLGNGIGHDLPLERVPFEPRVDRVERVVNRGMHHGERPGLHESVLPSGRRNHQDALVCGEHLVRGKGMVGGSQHDDRGHRRAHPPQVPVHICLLV